MRYILLPEEKISRRLAFYLAVEEVVARRYPGVDAFFAWRVSPTVIVGRNQLIDKEDFWNETSGSAMFTYAMIAGIKAGWLDADTYTPVVRKA